MRTIQDFPDIPNCALTRALAERALGRKDVKFDFLGELETLRKRVSAEVLFINRLFPEYTPHDEQYHLSRLLHVADTVLGEDVINSLNAAELFVLCASLYGHDWGMAVSEPERELITKGTVPDGVNKDDIWVLNNEEARLRKFARTQGISFDETKSNGLSDADWREYVRQTHAERSGERVRRHFEKLDGGVADATARVCEGHWVDFDVLSDPKRYPSDFTVIRENVDLTATAAYVRLVDLFDIGEDRTPYVIWKFVAPRDKFSRMEWSKHRSLRPVTCPPYQTGRIVLVDGSTDNHDVYASLEDLRIYCEGQLRGCNDILARNHQEHYHLNLFHVEWRVTARGFNPMPLRFEFDRGSMFDILSDEIYDGDTHVFLRELLQNSIDAIRLRRALLERKGLQSSTLGCIRVKADHRPDGDVVVEWTDDGIGMDEYIIQNYLTVAGRSYYRSDDFLSLGLSIDPISRFGIGILSCFMVAERIEIVTFRDPYSGSRSPAFHLSVPAVEQQIRVEQLNNEDAKVGTRVTVFVESKRLSDGEQAGEFTVVDYLRMIAGFVEFPILIEERGKRTMIVAPDSDLSIESNPYGEISEVLKLDSAMNVESAFLPQDAAIAADQFLVKHFFLEHNSYLKDAGYQGFISYLVPKNDIVEIGYEFVPGRGDGHRLHFGMNTEPNTVVIRTTALWSEDYYQSDEDIDGPRSARHHPLLRVYRDGILTPNTKLVAHWHFDISMPLPQVAINISKEGKGGINISRTMIGDNENWFRRINAARLSDLASEWRGLRSNLSLEQRFFAIGRFLVDNRVEQDDVFEVVEHEDVPILKVSSGGEIELREWSEIRKSLQLQVLTAQFQHSCEALIFERLVRKSQDYISPMDAWRGSGIVITELAASNYRYLNKSLECVRSLLRSEYYRHSYNAVESNSVNTHPLFEEVWRRLDEVSEDDKNLTTSEIADKVVQDFELLSPYFVWRLNEKAQFWNYGQITGLVSRIPLMVNNVINLHHPIGLMIMQVDLLIISGRFKETTAQGGRLADAARRFSSWFNRSLGNEAELETITARFESEARIAGVPAAHNLPGDQLSSSDFWTPVPLRAISAEQVNPRFGLPLE